MRMTPRRITAVVLACHFAAAFGAMGMPPFLALSLGDIAPDADPRLTGWLYVVPTVCLAVSAPFWGRMADRWGRKPLLLRAQIGLTLSFLLSGIAGSVPVLTAALCLQGLLGGTFAASNAYLAEALPKRDLAHGLNLTQATARLALIVAPATIGLLVDYRVAPQHAYLWLAALPAIAAALTLLLPASDSVAPVAAPARAAPERVRPPAPMPLLLAAQAGFTFALVASFPYLLPYAVARFAIDTALAGWVFGLPHIVYLALCVPLGRLLRPRDDVMRWFAAGCLILGATLGTQAIAGSFALFVVERLLMGLGMTLGYVAMNALIADAVEMRTAGRVFGRFDSAAKIATVAAGAAAGELSALAGMGGVLLASTAVAALVGGAALLARPLVPLPSVFSAR